MPKILDTAFDDEFCDEAVKVLGSKGIHTHCGNRVASIDGNSQVESVTLENRRKIQADMVLVSIGAKPANELAQKAGLRIVENGSIWVESICELTLRMYLRYPVGLRPVSLST